jgi:hypothetical protein
MTYRLTITAEHVRNPRSIGKFWHPLFQCIGRLLLCDVGKRVYERNGVWQVENNEQRDQRLAHERRLRSVMRDALVTPGALR